VLLESRIFSSLEPMSETLLKFLKKKKKVHDKKMNDIQKCTLTDQFSSGFE